MEVAKLGSVGELWLQADREREAWRDAHRFLEWDGWEEGLLTTVIGDKGTVDEVGVYGEKVGAIPASSARVGVGGTSFKMGNGFVGLTLA